MKIKNIIHFSKDTVGGTFFPNNPRKELEGYPKVTVIFENDGGNEESKYYRFVNVDDLYSDILNKRPINLELSFIKGKFDINTLRERYKEVNNDDKIEIFKFKANESFWNDAVNFSNIIFSADTYFDDAIFYENVEFQKTTFKEDISFAESHFLKNSKFSFAIFEKNANFFYSNFRKDTKFNNTEFKVVSIFENCKFLGNTNFYHSNFNLLSNFNSVSFFNKISFESVNFWDTVNFSDSIFSSLAIFKNSTFHLNSNFQLCLFEKQADFSEAEFTEADFRGSIFKEYAVFKDSKIKKADRETFRIVKHELIKINNKLDAMEYNKKEMEAYSIELKEKYNFIGSPKSIKAEKNSNDTEDNDKINSVNNINKVSRYKIIVDRIVLNLNKWTNDYGTNSFRAVLFTFFISIFFSIIFALSFKNNLFEWGCNDFGSFIIASGDTCKYYFQFLFAYKGDETFKYLEPNGWGYVLFYISRVIIIYCFWQILQPLRKFKTN